MIEDNIPIVERYRGVGIHNSQPQTRIEGLVKPAIDRVHSLAEIDDLISYARAVFNPPEARMFAAEKAIAAYSIAAEDRRERPKFDRLQVRALVAGLNSVTWRSPTHYGTDLCQAPIGDALEAVAREVPLSDNP